MLSANAVEVSERNINVSASKLRYPTWATDFLVLRDSKPALATTQPLIKWAEYSGPYSHTRAVRKVSGHFEYLENRSRGLDVTWQPVRGDLTVYP